VRLLADVDRSDGNHCSLTGANMPSGPRLAARQPRLAPEPASSCPLVARATTLKGDPRDGQPTSPG
jgi:hypothetical protein